MTALRAGLRGWHAAQALVAELLAEVAAAGATSAGEGGSFGGLFAASRCASLVLRRLAEAEAATVATSSQLLPLFSDVEAELQEAVQRHAAEAQQLRPSILELHQRAESALQASKALDGRVKTLRDAQVHLLHCL